MYSKALIVALGLVLLCLTTSCSAQRSNITCTVNRCHWHTATDLRGQATIEIEFGDYYYNPPCVRISVNTTVTFIGSFLSHPLAPGMVSQSYTFTEDNTSFVGTVVTGYNATFTTTADTQLGVYPYICTAHYNGDMYGAIWVEDDTSEEAWSPICVIETPEAPVTTEEPVTVPAVQLGSSASALVFSAGLIGLSALLM